MEPVRKIAKELYAPEGSDGIWWLGNAGFAIRLGNHYVFIDPAVTEEAHEWERVHDFPLPPDEIQRADHVLYTHEHSDHMDRGLFSRLVELNASVCAPLYCRKFLLERGVPERLIKQSTVGGSFAGDGYTIDVIRARHASGAELYYSTDMDQDDVTCGYLVQTRYGTIFHPGDSVYLKEFKHLQVDYLLLPVNDTNLNVGFAAQLTDELQPKAVIPCHYGMWAPAKHWQGGHPAEYLTALAARGYTLPQTDVLVLKPGGKLVLTPRLS